MIRRVFDLEERTRRGFKGEIMIFKVQIYRWQVFGLTVWKTETFH